MGAGCYYTSDIDKEKTFWLELPSYTEEDFKAYQAQYLEDCGEHYLGNFEDWCYYQADSDYEYVMSELEYFCDSQLSDCWSFDAKSKRFENSLYYVDLESTYYGDGLVFNFKSIYEDCYYPEDTKLHNLAVSNYHKTFQMFKRKLIDFGFNLFIATSSYTSTKLTNK